MQQITLSPTLSIPLMDYATQGNAVLGIRDSGKSYSATFFAERLLDAGIPFLAFDPIGIWRYLKVPGSVPNGRGYPVVVAGEQGDIPLSPDNAAEIVRAAMKENIPLVVDLFSMHLSKADWRRIVETCVNVLLYENKQLRHVFIEEAAEFCPQRIGPDMGRVYSAVEKLARMGGNRHLGYTLINQRAEAVNKEVLELCDCLLLHRQKGKNSLLSLQKWLDVADAERAREVVASLPRMAQGECWVWTQNSSGPVRVSMPRKRSQHPDRRNPSAGVSAVAADVAPFVSRMKEHLASKSAKPAAKQAISTRANGTDSESLVALRREITSLQNELAQLRSQPPREVPILTQEQCALLTSAITDLKNQSKAIETLAQKFQQLMTTAQSARSTSTTTRSRQVQTPPPRELPEKVGERIPVSAAGPAGSGGVRRMMIALAQRPGLDPRQLALRAGLSSKSGTFRNYLSTLRKNNWLEKNSSGRFILTDAGLSALGQYTPLPTGAALQAHWISQLGKGPATMLSALVEVYPEALSKLELANRSGMANSGTFRNYLSELRGFELITSDSGNLRASPELFD